MRSSPDFGEKPVQEAGPVLPATQAAPSQGVDCQRTHQVPISLVSASTSHPQPWRPAFRHKPHEQLDISLSLTDSGHDQRAAPSPLASAGQAALPGTATVRAVRFPPPGSRSTTRDNALRACHTSVMLTSRTYMFRRRACTYQQFDFIP